MSYALITVTIKPSDSVWFGKAQPDTAKRMAEWTKTQPGYVSGSAQRIAPNTFQNIVIFDTKENLAAFVAGQATNPDFQARDAYKAANGLTSTQVQR